MTHSWGIGVEALLVNSQRTRAMIPPKFSHASVTGKLNSRSANWVREKLHGCEGLWAGTATPVTGLYGLSSVRVNEETIRTYVDYPFAHHHGQLRIPWSLKIPGRNARGFSISHYSKG